MPESASLTEEELRQLNGALLFLEGLVQIAAGMAALEGEGVEDGGKGEKECSGREMS